MSVHYGKSCHKGSKTRFQILVKPEGESRYRPTSITFKNRKKAETFAGIESVAGMGEDYIVKRICKKRR